MEISMTKKVPVQAKTLKINIKIRDGFSADLTDQDDVELINYDGYVPNFMPENDGGDYLVLHIDIDTGQVVNWKTPSRKEIEKFIATKNEDDE